jgi:hypothetical protein
MVRSPKLVPRPVVGNSIPDFISFMRARNPGFGPKMGIKNRGFRALRWRVVSQKHTT